MWQDLYVSKKQLLINNPWHLSYEFRWEQTFRRLEEDRAKGKALVEMRHVGDQHAQGLAIWREDMSLWGHKRSMVPLCLVPHRRFSPQAAEDVTGEEGAQPAPVWESRHLAAFTEVYLPKFRLCVCKRVVEVGAA